MGGKTSLALRPSQEALVWENHPFGDDFPAKHVWLPEGKLEMFYY